VKSKRKRIPPFGEEPDSQALGGVLEDPEMHYGDDMDNNMIQDSGLAEDSGVCVICN
jgi:hypothetical protein